MPKHEWEEYEIVIGPPGTPKSERIIIPIHGEKQSSFDTKIKNAFCNASKFLDDSEKVEGDSQLILSAFSCELFLKAIIMKTQHKIVTGHDLYVLYNALGDNEQNFLLNAYLEESSNSKIDNSKDEFNKWLMIDARIFEIVRYKHEIAAMVYSDCFLIKFAHNLRKLGFDLKIEK